jgi:hypothetical protein
LYLAPKFVSIEKQPLKTLRILMKNFLLLFYLAAALFSPTTSGKLMHRVCDGFLPENNMKIPVGTLYMDEPSGITEGEFNAVLDRIQLIYGKEIESGRHVKFVINRNWADDTVNAYATQSEDFKTWSINMLGGLARHQVMTPDAFAAVACHETGHHIGGAPHFKNDNGTSDWAAVEGEADYFSMLKCLRRFFEHDDNAKILAGRDLNPIGVENCKAQHPNKRDAFICIRSVEAALALGRFFRNMGDAHWIALDTPDETVVDGVRESHPENQCRLDTFYHAALCTVPVSKKRSDTDYRAGACVNGNSDPIGHRPKCWFNPRNS